MTSPLEQLEQMSDEELVLLARSGNGDAKRALAVLVDRTLRPMLPMIAGAASRTGIPKDDLMQEARLAIIRAARTFCPERGRRFSSHAYQWVWAGLNNAAWEDLPLSIPDRHRVKIRQRPEDLPQVVSGDRELPGGEEVWDLIPDPGPDVLECVEQREAVEQVLDALCQLERVNPRQAEMLRMRFWYDMTLEEIAQRCGVHRETVRQAINKALSYLRAAISPD